MMNAVHLRAPYSLILNTPTVLRGRLGYVILQEQMLLTVKFTVGLLFLLA